MPDKSLRAGSLFWIVSCLLACIAHSDAFADDPRANDLTRRAHQILKANCFSCHSHEANKSRGGLMLDSRSALLVGGDTGPAIELNKVADSLLLKAIRHEDDLAMPPKGKLSDADIKLLTEWISAGATWPEHASAPALKARPRGTITPQDRAYWFFQPIKSAAGDKPMLANALAQQLDALIDQQHRQHGLERAPPANKTALLRRVTFDTTGLPPSPGELANFLADQSPDAYEKVVDRLLASPQFAVHQAVDWLDLVRYAESDGYKADDYRPTAWRYRDYVIRSIAQDKSVAQFIREQLAGDELPDASTDSLIATGFMRLGIYEYNNRDVRRQFESILDELTDVVGDTFLAMGMQCARCHDHKFDPILQSDYYALRSFFAGYHPIDDKPIASAAELQRYQAALATWEAQTKELRDKIAAFETPVKQKAAASAIEKFAPDLQQVLSASRSALSPRDQQIADLASRQVLFEYEKLDAKMKEPTKSEYLKLLRELARLEANKPKPLPTTMIATDIGPNPPSNRIPKQNREVGPALLTVLGKDLPTIQGNGQTLGRRTALANWLVSVDNPMTTRVLVNRIWKHYFGKGIVDTPSDFGTQGGKPTHPQLLDTLADQLRQHDWRAKSIHRAILLSQTYQQATTHPRESELSERDPNNHLLWKQRVRRLTGEQIRDAMLMTSGQLDLNAEGPSVEWWVPRRTVFLKKKRNTREPLLEVFDGPDGNLSVADRHQTTTSVQSLYLANSSATIEYAHQFAGRVVETAAANRHDPIETAYELAYQRPATTAERLEASELLREIARTAAAQPSQTTQTIDGQRVGKLAGLPGTALLLTDREGSAEVLATKQPIELSKQFTIVANLQLQSVYPTGMVRPIISQGALGATARPAKDNAESSAAGWQLGVTGKQSRYRPNTLVFQFQDDANEPEEPAFSGFTLDAGKVYQVIVGVDLSGKTPTINFALKNLLNDDEPMLTSKIVMQRKRAETMTGPLFLGARVKRVNAKSSSAVPSYQLSAQWDGLLDEVRIHRTLLTVPADVPVSVERSESLVAAYRFEPSMGIRQNLMASDFELIGLKTSSASGQPKGKSTPATLDRPLPAGLSELCHALICSNEFLYLD